MNECFFLFEIFKEFLALEATILIGSVIYYIGSQIFQKNFEFLLFFTNITDKNLCLIYKEF